MLPRHSNEVLSRLERVYVVGCSEVRNDELLLWYNQQRVTVGIWRDIADKWAEILEQVGHPAVPLLIGWANGTWVLVWGEGLTPSKSAWLTDIDTMLRRREVFTLAA